MNVIRTFLVSEGCPRGMSRAFVSRSDKPPAAPCLKGSYPGLPETQAGFHLHPLSCANQRGPSAIASTSLDVGLYYQNCSSEIFYESSLLKMVQVIGLHPWMNGNWLLMTVRAFRYSLDRRSHRPIHYLWGSLHWHDNWDQYHMEKSLSNIRYLINYKITLQDYMFI